MVYAKCCPDKPHKAKGLCRKHYRDAFLERHKAYEKKFYIKHRDKRLARVKRWRAKNAQRVAEYNERRKLKTGIAFRGYKESRGCSRCGYNKYGGAIDFHHVDPKQKSFKITQEIWGLRQPEEVAAEIAKCVLLCKNCHSEVHEELRQKKNGFLRLQSETIGSPMGEPS